MILILFLVTVCMLFACRMYDYKRSRKEKRRSYTRNICYNTLHILCVLLLICSAHMKYIYIYTADLNRIILPDNPVHKVKVTNVSM